MERVAGLFTRDPRRNWICANGPEWTAKGVRGRLEITRDNAKLRECPRQSARESRQIEEGARNYGNARGCKRAVERGRERGKSRGLLEIRDCSGAVSTGAITAD